MQPFINSTFALGWASAAVGLGIGFLFEFSSIPLALVIVGILFGIWGLVEARQSRPERAKEGQ